MLPTLYDDGGCSGGTLERPALQRLLADIADGKVDVVVVYKIDRLTRSLFDFAKIVEAFDARGVSFVSITQQFNTTTSMGAILDAVRDEHADGAELRRLIGRGRRISEELTTIAPDNARAMLMALLSRVDIRSDDRYQSLSAEFHRTPLCAINRYKRAGRQTR